MHWRLEAAVLLLGITLVAGCVTAPVTTTIVAQPGRRVAAEAEKFNVFFVSPLPVETTASLLDSLVTRCEGADLTGVTIASRRAWVVIGMVEKISVSGYCVDPAGRPSGPAGP
jgi:hypothetical protein